MQQLRTTNDLNIPGKEKTPRKSAKLSEILPKAMLDEIYELIINKAKIEQPLKWHTQEATHQIDLKEFRQINSANALTKCVIKFLKLKGHKDATRVNVMGRKIKKGNKEIYIKSTMQKGIADISATIHGIKAELEIKYGRDVQSDKQKEREADVIASGGVYVIIRSFNQFYGWYQAFTTIENIERLQRVEIDKMRGRVS